MHPRRKRGRFLAVAALLASGIVGLDATSSAVDAEERSAGEASTQGPRPPGKRLLAHLRPGRAALNEIGDDVAAAARVNHVSEARLRRLIIQDPTVWLGR